MKTKKNAGIVSVSITLSKTEAELLDHLADTSRLTGGMKLSPGNIMRALVRLAMELQIDLKGAYTVEEIKKRIAAALPKEKTP